MASVLPRRNPSGSISWRVQGRDAQKRMRQESFIDEKAARQFGALVDAVGWEAALAVRDARDGRDMGTPTLREFTATYLSPESGYLTGVTDATREGYQQIADRSFLKILGDLPIDVVTKQDVGRWVTWQERQPSSRHDGNSIAAKTVRNYHGLLSSVLAAAAEKYKLEGNPAKGTRLTPGQRHGITFLTPTEFDTLLQFVPAYYRPLTLMLVGTGARWGEITALVKSDFDLDASPAVIRITKAWKKGVGGKPVIGPPKTQKSIRTVSLSPELVEVVRPLLAGLAGDQIVFAGARSGEMLWGPRFYKAAWTPAVNAANDPARLEPLGLQPIGKRPRVHDLRHTHASWLLGRGVPLSFVQARLGHENITTTVDTYGHLLPEAHIQMAQIVSEAMSDVLPRTATALAVEA